MYISVCSGKPMTKMRVNASSEITAACNKDCKCSTFLSQPVCGSNNVAYFDACHAGCQSKISDDVSRKTFLKACSNKAHIMQRCWPNNVARCWMKILSRLKLNQDPQHGVQTRPTCCIQKCRMMLDQHIAFV